MTFSDQLRSAPGPTWEDAVDHRFVDELWRGRVDPGVLARHLVLDHQFLDATTALLGAAVAAADRPEPRITLARRLGALAGPEHDSSARALDALDVPLADRTHPELGDPARTLLDLRHGARRSADYATCLTVLLAGEWLHLDQASRNGAEPTDEPLQRTWIDLHRGPAFESWVAFLRLELDRTAAGLDDARRDGLRELFTRVAELELALLDEAYL